jgi:hypothetical protein
MEYLKIAFCTICCFKMGGLETPVKVFKVLAIQTLDGSLVHSHKVVGMTG